MICILHYHVTIWQMKKNEGNVTYYYAMDGAYDYENHYDLIELEFADLEVNEDE